MGLDVLLYFWDERDGAAVSGWWFGPKVGGDQVWAYQPDGSTQTPPMKGWKVPFDGPVDPMFTVASSFKQQQESQAQTQNEGGAQQQQQPQQQQWGQQSQQQQQWGQQSQQQQWG